MNKIYVLLLLLVISITINAQNEEKEDSLLIKHLPKKEISGETLLHQELLTKSMNLELKNKELLNEGKLKLPDYLNYKIKLTADLKPQRLSSTLLYSLDEYKFDYVIGEYRQGGIILIYKPLEKLKMSFGGYTVNYSILKSRYNDIMFDYNAQYDFTDWMQLSVFGKYSVKSIHNARIGGYMFSPQTSYGANLKFRTSEKLDINLGISRVLNSLTKGWGTNYILGPSIHLK